MQDLDQPNLKLLIDSYHMQMLNGNLTANVNDLRDLTGHVQISQAPLRDRPVNVGEINFEYFLGLIAKSGYTDYVGLEYNGEWMSLNDQFESSFNFNHSKFKFQLSSKRLPNFSSF